MTNDEAQALQTRLDEIEKRVAALELPTKRLGPNPAQNAILEQERDSLISKLVDTSTRTPPVDRSARVLVSGAPVPEDQSHTEIKDNGQQKDYVVLTADERHRGFVRPYRDAYLHLKCGKITTMGRAIAETYARDPTFYSGTFCTTCMEHYPVGEHGQFVWYEMDGSTSFKVGT